MKNALLLIGGDYHPFIRCGQLLAEALFRSGACQMTIADDREQLAHLAGYDLVIIYTQGGALTPAQEAGLCDFVARGGGLIGIHSATASFTENERYLELIGSRFVSHGPLTEFAVAFSDHDHEITRRCSDFRVVDEFYLLEPKSEFQTLATGSWHFQPHPLVYVKSYGAGRVFYTALGHDERAFAQPEFQKLIHRAVRWVTRQAEAAPVRCGIVGYGGAFNMGKLHADTIRQIPGMTVTAVCDTDPQRRSAAQAEQPDVTVHASVEEMIAADRIDLGVIVTPHNTHAPLALTLLNAGKHVVCEKPFCLTYAEATAMIEAAQAHGVMLSAFHNRRWDGDFVTIRRLLNSGAIGEPFHIEAFIGNYGHPGTWWRSHKPISGGVLYDWGAHFVDWILALLPGPVESVTGIFHKRLWHDVTNEDQGQAILRFAGGRVAELQISSIAAVARPKWRILGTQGGLIGEWEKPIQVVSYVSGGREERSVPTAKSRWDAYYYNVADHLLSGEPLAVTAESARRVIAVLEAATRSGESGLPERVAGEG